MLCFVLFCFGMFSRSFHVSLIFIWLCLVIVNTPKSNLNSCVFSLIQQRWIHTLNSPSVPEEAFTIYIIHIGLYILGLHNEDTLPLVMLDLFFHLFSSFYFCVFNVVLHISCLAPREYFCGWLGQPCANRAGPAISAQVLIVIAGGLFAA